MAWCCVKACSSKTGHPKGIKFHIFPKNEPVFNQWVLYTGRSDITIENRRSYRVCDIHFSDDWKFPTFNSRTNLKVGAIPTLYLNGPLPSPSCLSQLPAPSTNLPTPSENVPTPSENVPTPSENVPTSSDSLTAFARKSPTPNRSPKMIEAEFEGRNPDGRDFDGVKTLLQQLFLKAHVNLSQLSDLLIEHNNVGSVLKQCNDDEEDEDDADDEELYNTDDDVFGITTVLNITHNKEANCIQELRSLLIELTEKHADEQTNNTIRNILGNDAKPVGLIINERFINIPAQICVPLFDSLINEINRANNKKNSQFNFAYYVLICKAFREESKKSSNENLNTNEIQFTNAEEEIFDKEAELKFEFCVKNESDSGVSGSWEEDDKVLIPYRRILLFPAQKLPSILGQIKEFVTTP